MYFNKIHAMHENVEDLTCNPIIDDLLDIYELIYNSVWESIGFSIKNQLKEDLSLKELNNEY